jgi:integrase
MSSFLSCLSLALTDGQLKVLPLTDSVIKELELFDAKDSSLIFASRIKYEVAYCFTKPWKRVLKEADIKDFRFHDLRHSCASYLAQSGTSLLEIADVLGHKQISVTKRYSNLCIEHKSSLINRVLGGIGCSLTLNTLWVYTKLNLNKLLI